MPEILRRVIGLRHGAQGGHVDDLGMVGVLGCMQERVEMRGAQHLPLGQHQPCRLGHLAQAVELFGAGFLVHAEKQRRFARDQRLGGGHIGQHHAFLDQLVRVQPVGEIDRQNLALVAQHHLALGQVEVERLPLVTGLSERVMGGIERADHLVHQGAALVIRCAVHRGLDLLIAQRGGRAHQATHEPVPDLLTMGVDLHPNRQAGARHTLVQGAQIA